MSSTQVTPHFSSKTPPNNSFMDFSSRPSVFQVGKLKKDAQRNWDLFYMRNKTNFFKDRNWTKLEFGELNPDGKERVLLELGCGVGNTIWPLLKLDPLLTVYCCDFSKRAIDFVKIAEGYLFICLINFNDSLYHSID